MVRNYKLYLEKQNFLHKLAKNNQSVIIYYPNMGKILGIDTGTNSLGWAIVEQHESTKEYTLLDHGIKIFQEGVKIEKGIESSKASERTEHRSQRRHYWRRKVRKIRLLTILSSYQLCPPLEQIELRNWRTKSIYPSNDEFLTWQRTEDKIDKNPYHDRFICLTRKLDLSIASQRYILGRALYHINQRRGFLSNRKESTKESDGKVISGINDLTNQIESEGCQYLGEYFYKLYQRGEKIRTHYTARNEHYLKEFRAICQMQELEEDLIKKLEKAIFFQRPLKSQKGLIGKCSFEPKKDRCPVSHPLFEEFRMYSFINNIKMREPGEDELRPLSAEEIQQIIPLFMRKKTNFQFKDIAKKLAGKSKFCYYKDSIQEPYAFNYFMDTNVTGCPVTSNLKSIFGDDWVDSICSLYTKAVGKSQLDIINDIWHVLFSFSDADHLCKFAKDHLQLNNDDAKKFSEVTLPQDYASLSLKAIKNILPFLKKWGLIYSEAVFMAKVPDILPDFNNLPTDIQDEMLREIIEAMRNSSGGTDALNKEQRLKNFIKSYYHIDDTELAKLYHPSMLETYPTQQKKGDVYQLGSPRTSSMRNPMAMRSLHQIRHTINTLLREGKIDEETEIHIEFARELNDANRRAAIRRWQRDNEKDRDVYRERIKEYYSAYGIMREPSDTDILKYQLWEEQGNMCLYTGKMIGIEDFLGQNPKFDIEHTVPQSCGGDSSKMNLTLCESKFNRETKKALLPSQLANHDEILVRVERFKAEWEHFDALVRRTKGVRSGAKEDKDRNIEKRHYLTLKRDYYRGKYLRFTMTEVPEGFSRRQSVDIGVISRYARLYLKSVFQKVFIVKGIATSDFRKIWGIQDDYTKKERINHVHHCIDAITIACIGQYEYSQLAQYYHGIESSKLYGTIKPRFPKPWETFTEDMKHLHDSLLVVHRTPDNMPKAGRRKIDTPDGRVLAKGDTARGSLHHDTFYGAISHQGEIKYVVRKPLASLEAKNLKNIVDDEVRHIVEQAIIEYGSLKVALEKDGVWMNKAKGVRIKSVRVFAQTTDPVHIREHRDSSRHEHKRQIHVANDRNYLIAIYEGYDSKGRIKREFKLVSNLEAAKYFRRSKTQIQENIIPEVNKSGYKLLYILKIGTMVLLYEKSLEEIWSANKIELSKRLYKISGLGKSGNYIHIQMHYHQEARPSDDVKAKNGSYSQNEELRPAIIQLHTQFKALVEGIDFEITELGEIKRLK